MATLVKYIKPHPVTTAQRTAMTSLLTALGADVVNITVLDTDSNILFRWNGSGWSALGSNKTFAQLLAEDPDANGAYITNVQAIQINDLPTDPQHGANKQYVDNEITAIADGLNGHKSDTANPHIVTLEQAREAGNVVSGEINMNGYAIKNLPAAVDGGDPVRKSEYDSLLSVVVKRRGGIDLSTNPNFPASEAGDRWEVTHAGKVGGNDGIELEIWDEIVCTETNAGGDWLTVGDKFYFVQANVGAANESVSGTIRLATDAETQAGTNNTKAITALKLANWWSYIKGLAHTFAAKITFTTAPRLSSTTANQYLKVDANKDVESVANIPAADVAESATKRFASDTEKATWNAKQNALTFDSTPTAGSTNPVTSGGVKTALDGKLDYAEVSFATAKKFDKNYIVPNRYNITGAVSITLDTTGYKTGRSWLEYWVANGVNVPSFSSAFKDSSGNIAWDGFENVNGAVHEVHYRSTGTNKVAVHIRRVE